MTNLIVVAIRGAITVEQNTRDDIVEATQELLSALVAQNDLDIDNVISVLFTTTPDLNAAFPATAARAVGFSATPLMCACEIDVPGAKSLVIRVMMHAYSATPKSKINHVYLRDAISLRDDVER